MSGDHDHTPRDFGPAFAWGIALNAAYVIVEAGFGFLSGSLALVADAAHNLTDVGGLVLAWGAVALSRRKPSDRHTYGLGRTSILAALVNGVNVMSKFAAEFMPSFAEMKGAISTSLDLVVEGMADLVAGVEDLWTKGGEWVDGVAAKVSGAVKSIESVWAEFKSSRIYRTFGGGN